MPVLSTIVAIAAIAAVVGSTIQQQSAAKKQAKAAKQQAEDAREAARDANAAKVSEGTGANVSLAASDTATRRGKGSLASRRKAASLGLDGPSASSVGGL